MELNTNAGVEDTWWRSNNLMFLRDELWENGLASDTLVCSAYQSDANLTITCLSFDECHSRGCENCKEQAHHR